MSDSTLLMPVEVAWTITSSGDQPQTVTADPLVIQVAQIHLGLKGDKGNKGDKGDTPEVTLSALAARDAAVQAASNAQGSADTAIQMAQEAQAQAQAAAQSAAEIDPSNILRRLAAGDPLPSANVGPIWHEAYASVMTWRTIGAYTGYASVDLGKVAYFDKDTAPTGWLVSMGQTLSASYEALIQFRGSATLRDLRAEFIRGWDNGRGIDTGRAFGSSQTSQNLAHSHDVTNSGTSSSASGATRWIGGTASGSHTITSSSHGGTEARPRNVALLPCIKF